MRSALTATRQYGEVASTPFAINESARTVRHVVSTEALDRNGRVVSLSGWKLENFKRNPVVFADHGNQGDYTVDKIIGTSQDVRVEGAALMATTRFAKEGIGDAAFRLVQAGLAKSWSVGWQGLKAHYMDDGAADGCATCTATLKAQGKGFTGRHFTEQDLLEYSLVAIPSNPEVVMSMLEAAGVGRTQARAWVREFRPAVNRPSLRPATAAAFARAKLAFAQRREFQDACDEHVARFNPTVRACENEIARLRGRAEFEKHRRRYQ